MNLPRNPFKAACRERRLQIGLWSTLCSPIVADAMGDAGFDWVLVDTEHSPNELPDVMAQLQALRGGTAAPVVRPAWNDPVLLKRFLDIGAQSVLVPMVQNEDEAARAVAACRYPPKGIRGVTGSGRAARYGRVRDYLHRAEEEICVLVQVETPSAMARLEAIAAVDGVDGVFIGPADLSASMGHIGNPNHPDVQHEIQRAAAVLKGLNKAAGILTVSEADARRYIDWGYTFVAVGTDLGLLTKAADALAKSFKA